MALRGGRNEEDDSSLQAGDHMAVAIERIIPEAWTRTGCKVLKFHKMIYTLDPGGDFCSDF